MIELSNFLTITIVFLQIISSGVSLGMKEHIAKIVLSCYLDMQFLNISKVSLKLFSVCEEFTEH